MLFRNNSLIEVEKFMVKTVIIALTVFCALLIGSCAGQSLQSVQPNAKVSTDPCGNLVFEAAVEGIPGGVDGYIVDTSAKAYIPCKPPVSDLVIAPNPDPDGE